ncbi:MAG: gamma-glutamylcyclotransferase [Myxococcales bacterium]|nr:gamma-glutamylcyclotransferase [Myxococcales bacterium]
MSQLVFAHNAFAWQGSRHAVLGDAFFAGRGAVRGVAYAVPDAGGEAMAALGIRAGGDSWVPGELYWCDAATVAALDAAHGPDCPRRRWQVRAGSDGPRVDAWVWPWSGDWTGAWQGRELLQGCLLPGTASRPTSWYFGYASNMFHFGERRQLTVHDTKLARLDQWQVAFGKDSQDDHFCYVTVLPKRNGVVRGAIYRMPNAEMEASLDPQEKEGRHLERKTVALRLDDGTDRVVWADLYRTMPRWWMWGRISHPRNTEKILAGAKELGLEPAYVAWLEGFVHVPCDPDAYDLDLHRLEP